MRGKLAGWVLIGSTLAGCGGLVVFERGQGDDDGWGGSSSYSASQSGVASSVVSTGGSSDLVATIEAAKFGANCMPVVGPDPLSGTVLVRYDNLGSAPGELKLESASVTFSNPTEAWVFDVELAPDTSGVVAAGASAAIEHAKVEALGDSSFVCQLCGLSGLVQLGFADAEGRVQSVSESFELGCAY